MYIKGFDENLQCRDYYQFEIGKEYKIEKNKKLKLCSNTVFHFCDSLQKVDEYYRADSDNNRFCEIEVLGEIVSDGKKMGSNHIKIIREIVGEELEILKGHINNNSGLFNSGHWNCGNWNSGNRNSGNWNSGNWNSGNRNSGNRNSGNWNCGDWNSGHWNSGNWNSGNRNSGDWNCGNRNSGDWNSGNGNCGDRNSGDRNIGNRNIGNRNSGNCNSGDWNSGNCNIGYWNCGNRNSGNCNSGFWNSGNWNCGDWNSGDCNSGVFNNTQSKIRMFNNECDWTFNDWRNSNACKIMNTMPQKIKQTVFIEEPNMTNKEKESHPEYKTIGGYLKVYSDNVNVQEWWDNLVDSDKADVIALPNFDKTVFREITGIEV